MKKHHCLLLKSLFLLSAGVVLWSGCKKDETPDPDPVPPSVKQEDVASVDSLVSIWMAQYNMPGVSVAVSKDGRLVYKKGYGVEDPETNEKVSPESQFRIASVSKLVTSVATMKLIEAGKITMEQKVFGPEGILGTAYGTQPYKQYVTDVTVADLLRHTSGGWGQDNDPAFFDISMSKAAVINRTLDNVALTRAPGTGFAYSNFGYMLLSEIIEKVSGKSYAQFVQEEIWNKVNATQSTIAGSKLADRLPNEVKYTGQGGDIPFVYNMNFSRADAAMGWVSTPADLLKFATAVDSSNTRPDILSPQTIRTMVTTTPASVGFGFRFGCGWVVDGNEWFWWGTLPGTYAILYRNGNGICIAATANSRSTNAVGSLNAFVDNIINYIAFNRDIPWQNIDQFK